MRKDLNYKVVNELSKRNDLTGKKFGNLTVIEKTGDHQGGYYTWSCRCDCGNEVIVSTKNLTSYRTTHCGCRAKELRNVHIKPKDRTGEKYGALTALQMAGKTDGGAFLWECECECGNKITVTAMQLQRGQVKDCGCGMGEKPKYKDITGMRKGQLTALYPTNKRDGKGSVVWLCRCDCGNEIEMTESDFMFGASVSCGCVRQQRLEAFTPSDHLTFVDGTCVEWLAKRKNRSDNSSGFRGVFKYSDTNYRVCIGLKGKKYDLGRYKTFEEAVSVRLAVEKQLHDGFLACWALWQKKAALDKQWAENNPFYFSVEKDQRTFYILSAVTEQIIFQF